MVDHRCLPHLEPDAPECGPRTADPDHPRQLGGGTIPLQFEVGRFDPMGIGGFALLGFAATKPGPQGLDKQGAA